MSTSGMELYAHKNIGKLCYLRASLMSHRSTPTPTAAPIASHVSVASGMEELRRSGLDMDYCAEAPMWAPRPTCNKRQNRSYPSLVNRGSDVQPASRPPTIAVAPNYSSKGRGGGGSIWSRNVERERITPQEARSAHELRMAVHTGGGSTQLQHNALLRNKVREFKQTKSLPSYRIHRILHECELWERDNATYVVHLDYGTHLAALVCTVRTDNLLRFKRKLAGLLRRHSARFYYAGDLFVELGVIEALVSHQMPVEFEGLEKALRSDAKWCKAEGVDMIDYEAGLVRFRCSPAELADIGGRLKQLGYKVLQLERGFCAREPINLPPRDVHRYQEFLQALRREADIVHIFDNVQRAEAAATARLSLK